MKKHYSSDEDLNWCEIQVCCYDCPFYMDDCDGDADRLSTEDEEVF